MKNFVAIFLGYSWNVIITVLNGKYFVRTGIYTIRGFLDLKASTPSSPQTAPKSHLWVQLL